MQMRKNFLDLNASVMLLTSTYKTINMYLIQIYLFEGNKKIITESLRIYCKRKYHKFLNSVAPSMQKDGVISVHKYVANA